MSGGHGPSIEGGNRQVALLIAVLALFLAFSEMLGKNAEKASMQANIEANNLWAFFQAKTIRRAMAQNLAEMIQIDGVGVVDDAKKAAIGKQVEAWTRLAARLESEPDTNEGRKELMARAKAAELSRDRNNQKNEGFEIASAILQISIVLASAMIITGITALAYLAGGFGIIAVVLMAVTQFAPTILPFL